MNNNQRAAINIILISILIAFIIFSYLLPIDLKFPFSGYSLARIKNQLIPIDPYDNIAGLVSRYLWDIKALDIINQAFVLLAAILGCISLLKVGDE